MAWHAQLQLQYAWHSGQVAAVHRHEGPLRVLQSLYPEGPGICHNVLVHPPGGLVGGDTLAIDIQAHADTHGLITTPGATRFYRSEGAEAVQQTRLHLQSGARLEWLPLEAICYTGCRARNHLVLQVEPGAELLAWDVTALGLPHAGQPFADGCFSQHLEIPGVWLERGQVHAHDALLLNSPAGLAGHRCLATLLFSTGTAMPRAQRERGLEAARALCDAQAGALPWGVTSPDARLLLLRVLSAQVEPAMQLLREVRNAWRREFWQLPPVQPRIWAM